MNERKRKAMLIMPVIIAPFVIFIFWILGLVGPPEAVAASGDARGINLNLPAAIPSSDSSWDKLHFYEAADKDSAKLKQLRRQDPYLNENKFNNDPLAKYGAKAKYQPYPGEALNEADEQEKKMYEKISAIHREIDREPRAMKKITLKDPLRVDVNKNNDVDRLERMMEMMHDKEPAEDPEMIEIQQLMEGIKDIQHPERVGERLEQQKIKAKVFEVKLSREEVALSNVQTNRFYSTENALMDVQANGIFAVVHETQKIASGDVIKMRLSQNIFIDNHELAANGFVYGAAKINGSRILLHVSFVQVGGEHLPVSLDAIGHDGLLGIPVMTSKASRAISQTADKAAQGISLGGIDNIGAQVAGAALQTGKQLFKKQTKVIQYQIPEGYQVQLVSAGN